MALKSYDPLSSVVTMTDVEDHIIRLAYTQSRDFLVENTLKEQSRDYSVFNDEYRRQLDLHTMVVKTLTPDIIQMPEFEDDFEIQGDTIRFCAADAY